MPGMVRVARTSTFHSVELSSSQSGCGALGDADAHIDAGNNFSLYLSICGSCGQTQGLVRAMQHCIAAMTGKEGAGYLANAALTSSHYSSAPSNNN